MSSEPPREPPPQEQPQEQGPPSPSPRLRVIWQSSGIFLASVLVLVVVISGISSRRIDDGSVGSPPPDGSQPPDGSPPPSGSFETPFPTLTPSGSPTQPPSPTPPADFAEAPPNDCPFRPDAFWMPMRLAPYGPFGEGWLIAWDDFGFNVWDPEAGIWLPYPGSEAPNNWDPLEGTPFDVCTAAGLGAPVFGAYG
jgi:hypothetical protein